MADFPDIPAGRGIPLVDLTTSLLPPAVTDAATGATGDAQGVIYPTGAAVGAITMTALQAACDAAAADGKRVWAAGAVTTSSTLLVNSDADLGQLTITYTGTGVAVQVGEGAGERVDYRNIVLPAVTNDNKVGTGWGSVAGSVGVLVLNANTCIITLQRVRNFETNLELRGEAAGCQYNTVNLPQLSNAKIGVRFSADGTGWVNQNTLIGGRIDMDSAEGDHATGSRYVLMEDTSNEVNGNTFVGTALEGNGAEYVIETYGQYNLWVGCRFEASLGAAVWWRAGATRNAIMQGYGAPTVTTESGALRNEVSQAGSRRDVTGSTTAGVFNFQNDSSGAAPAWTVMDPATPVASNDPATAYAFAATALQIKGKRPADTQDRISIDGFNGRILFGSGSVAPTAMLGFDSAGLIKFTAATVYPATDNTHDLGINATRWRYLRARTGVITGAFATGSRPTAAGGGIGTTIFDSTLNKPIWSDGTIWRDAMGTAV